MLNNPTVPSEIRDFVQADGETTQPVQRESDRTVSDWLNAFASQECDRAVMLRGVADILTTDRDAGWELLSLIDQYYRRRKISAEDFHALNAQMQTLLFGNPPAAAGAAPSTVRRPPVLDAPAPAPAPTMPAVTATTIDSTTKTDDTARPQPPRTVVVGELLRDRYRVQGVLGRGGMGIVYGAIDQYRVNEADSGQRVAIKVLNTQSARQPQLLEELRGEFQRLQSLSHPNIVRVHDFDRDGGLTFFTMEYLSGASLSRVLGIRNSAALHRSHAFSIIRQVGAAVAYAHSRGVVHGDLNPRNIFITDDGEVRVLDFGASHRLRPDPEISDLDDSSRIAVATPSYASCEMLVGRIADTRDDIYSLACIAYVMLRGKHPFHGNNALVARTRRLTPKRPAGVGARQWRALKAGLQMDRKHRPDNIAAWLEEFDLSKKPQVLPPLHALEHAHPPSEGHAPWLIAAAIALAAGLFWWAQNNPDLVARGGAAVATTVTTVSHQFSHEAKPGSIADTPPMPVPQVMQPAVQPETAATPKKAPSDAVSTVRATTQPHGAAHAGATAGVPAPATPARTAPVLARIELAADTVTALPLQPVASVVVQRRHNYRNGVSFSWWTESGTAKPGQDFVPVKARTDYIPAGENETHLLVPIVADPRRSLAKTFYVVVGDPSEDASLGARTITMVTIPAAR